MDSVEKRENKLADFEVIAVEILSDIFYVESAITPLCLINLVALFYQFFFAGVSVRNLIRACY